MIGNNQVCTICNLEASTQGCVCDGNLILLGNNCLSVHIKQARDHNLIDLNLALRMQADPSIVESYLDEQLRMFKPLKSLRKLLNKAKRVKKRYKVCKERLISHIEEIFDRPITEIEQISQEYSDKIKMINSFKSSLCDEGKFLIESFNRSGISGIVKDTVESIDIPLEEILDYLSRNIFMQTSNAKESCSLFERDRVFDTLRKEIEERDQKYKSLCDAYNHRVFQSADHKIKISNLKAQVEQLQSEVKARDNQANNYSQLEHQLSSSSKEIDDLKLDLQNKTNQINQKNHEMHRLTDRQNTLQFQISKLAKGCSESENKIQDQSRTIQRLERQNYSNQIISSKGKRYIYTPDQLSKSLIQYDIQSEKAKIIDIPTLTRNFYYTSSCELPNGDVFLAGFNHPVSSEAFIYKIANQEIITLPRLVYPRYFISLFYYRGYVYAFGGEDSNRAERFSLQTNSWHTLPDMRYRRSSLSCVGIDGKIYLFKGGYANIEIFNTTTLEFKEFTLDNSDSNSSDYGVAYRVDDRVYLVTDHLCQVYDTSLNKIAQYSNTYRLRHYSIHNIIYFNNSICYYNYDTLAIERIDTTFPALEPQVYSHNPNRYIYKTRDNTKELHRIDLEHSTIESIDLSATLNRDFCCTSVCVMNSGEVVIAGFYDRVSSECYLFSPATKSCKKLPNLKTPRCNTSLIYHNNSVYAFGGRDSIWNTINKVEKIDAISRRSWSVLHDMIKSRSSPSCIGVNDEIYIMGGGDISTEIYHINSGSYLLYQTPINSNYIVSVFIDDQIHIISEKNYKILTNNLKVISDLIVKYEGGFSTYTMGNSVYYEGKIYFYNRGKYMLERVNPIQSDRDIQIITHRTIPSL